jgi:hypothetical protein
MIRSISFLSAAFAVGALVALPALAETPSPASSTVPPTSAQVQTGVKTPAAQASTDLKGDIKGDAHKDKLSKDKKHSEVVATHPGTVVKDGASAGTKSEPTKQ